MSPVRHPSKVRLTDLGRPGYGTGTFEDLLDGLPTVLAAQSLKELRDAIVAAHTGEPTYWPHWVAT